jgi:hypothetical protein
VAAKDQGPVQSYPPALPLNGPDWAGAQLALIGHAGTPGVLNACGGFTRSVSREALFAEVLIEEARDLSEACLVSLALPADHPAEASLAAWGL